MLEEFATRRGPVIEGDSVFYFQEEYWSWIWVRLERHDLLYTLLNFTSDTGVLTKKVCKVIGLTFLQKENNEITIVLELMMIKNIIHWFRSFSQEIIPLWYRLENSRRNPLLSLTHCSYECINIGDKGIKYISMFPPSKLRISCQFYVLRLETSATSSYIRRLILKSPKSTIDLFSLLTSCNKGES